MQRIVSKSLYLLASFLVLWAVTSVPVTLAQSIQGSITGTVTDPTGAVIPKATVSATNVRTQFTRTTVTNDTGLYEFPNLDPSEFTVRAEAPGFKAYVNKSVPLGNREALRIDIQLEVGQVTQEVTVQSQAPVVRTEDAKLEISYTQRQWDESPVLPHGLGKTALEVGLMLPGIVYTRAFGSEGSALSVSGARSTDTKITVQGINQTSYGVYNVPASAVQELRVIRHTAPAEYPTAANFEMTLRGASSSYHAAVIFDLRNAKLNAGNFFYPRAKVGTPSYALSYNVGGPVYIPKLYPRKDKTFVFFTRERNKRTESIRTYLYDMPTVDMRAGNFSKLLIGGKPVTVIDPLTGQPFPNNTIPSTRINPVAQKILAIYPTANTGDPNSPVRNLSYDTGAFSGYSSWALRVDHNLTSKQTLSFAWGSGQLPAEQDVATAAQLNVPGLFKLVSVLASDTPSLAWTYAINPSTVNEFRVGGLRVYQNGSSGPLSLSGRGLDLIKSLGIQGINPGVDAQASPEIYIKEVSRISGAGQSLTVKDYYHLMDNVSLQRGNHGLKFGVDARLYQINQLSVPAASYGNLNFSGQFTGVGFGDFLLGAPETTDVFYPRPQIAGRYKEFGFYFQDKWAITRNITLTYGLREQFWTIPRDNRDLYYNFDPKSGQLVVPNDGALKYLNPNWFVNVPVITATQAGFPARLRNISYLNLAPRLALAWRPFGNDKTAVRAGYGIYHQPLTFESFTPFTGGPFAISLTHQNAFDATTGQFRFALPTPVPATVGPRTAPAGSLSFTAISLTADTVPYVQHFSLTADREVLRDTRLSLGYVGSKGTQLMYRRNINVPAPSTIPFTQARRPNPLYGTINLAENGGNQTYHSLELMLYRRMSAGLQIEAGYVWVKLINDVADSGSDLGPTIPDPFCRACNKARGEDVRTHSVKGNFLWDVPVGRDRWFWKNLPSVVNGIVGGWTIGGHFYIATGEPMTPIFTGRDISGTGITSGRPDRVCDGNISGPKYFTDKVADLNCFVIPPANTGRFGNSGRDIITGGNLRIFSTGFYKVFPITERLKFRIGAKVTQLFNNPTFGYHNTNITSPTGMQATEETKGGPFGRNLEFEGKLSF